MALLRRDLKAELFEYIDSRIVHSGEGFGASEMFVSAIETFVGIRETDGANNGKLVSLIQETVGAAQSEPWCVSMIQSGIGYVEVKTGLLCPLPATEHSLTLFEAAKDLKLVDFEPQRSDIMVWQHLKFGPTGLLALTNQGHAGVVTKSGDLVETIEGNTSPGPGVKREGDGVYRKLRHKTSSKNMFLRGFITVTFNKEVL